MQKNQSLLIDKVYVTRISLAQFEEVWLKHQYLWQEAGPFITPAWLTAWWSCFAGENELLLLCVSRNDEVLGVAPFMVQGEVARLVGSEDVCDYLDIVVLPEHNEAIFTALLSYFKKNEITELILEPVRMTSSVMKNFVPFARDYGCEVEIDTKNVTVKMELPASWDEYLAVLSKKQRHEVRRKFRRFSEAGSVATNIIKEMDEAAPAMDRFFRMFRESRKDKDSFMTSERELFFRELAQQLARAKMLYMLEIYINGSAAAMVFCVNLGSTTYLYNNGFNPEFSSTSVGVISKLMTIRQSIEAGVQHYDFLSGNEHYKFQLGGAEEKLLSFHIRLGS